MPLLEALALGAAAVRAVKARALAFRSRYGIVNHTLRTGAARRVVDRAYQRGGHYARRQLHPALVWNRHTHVVDKLLRNRAALYRKFVQYHHLRTQLHRAFGRHFNVGNKAFLRIKNAAHRARVNVVRRASMTRRVARFTNKFRTVRACVRFHHARRVLTQLMHRGQWHYLRSTIIANKRNHMLDTMLKHKARGYIAIMRRGGHARTQWLKRCYGTRWVAARNVFYRLQHALRRGHVHPVTARFTPSVRLFRSHHALVNRWVRSSNGRRVMDALVRRGQLRLVHWPMAMNFRYRVLDKLLRNHAAVYRKIASGRFHHSQWRRTFGAHQGLARHVYNRIRAACARARVRITGRGVAGIVVRRGFHSRFGVINAFVRNHAARRVMDRLYRRVHGNLRGRLHWVMAMGRGPCRGAIGKMLGNRAALFKQLRGARHDGIRRHLLLRNRVHNWHLALRVYHTLNHIMRRVNFRV